jgi:hypothetical protein
MWSLAAFDADYGLEGSYAVVSSNDPVSPSEPYTSSVLT